MRPMRTPALALDAAYLAEGVHPGHHTSLICRTTGTRGVLEASRVGCPNATYDTGATCGAWSTVGGRSLVDSMEECELVTHGHRHGDCLPGSVGGVSYGNGARSSTQGRQ